MANANVFISRKEVDELREMVRVFQYLVVDNADRGFP